MVPYSKELAKIIELLETVIVRLDMLLGICIAGIVLAIIVILVNKFTAKR